jgi:hypothetical protein
VTDVTQSGRQILVAVPSASGPRVFGSADRGASWTEERLPSSPVPSAEAIFADEDGATVAVISRDQTSSNFSSAHLYTRAGSGAWTRAELPAFGQVRRSTGSWWLAGGVVPSLHRSVDGGRSWRPVRLPPGCSPDGAVTAAPGVGVGGLVQVVSTVGDPGGSSEVRLCTSADEGGSWQLQARASVRSRLEAGVAIPSSVIGTAVWAVAPDAGTAVVISGGAVRRTIPRGLPAGVTSIVATSSRTAWASTSTTRCPSGKASCVSTEQTYATVDGGTTWTRRN